MARKRRRRHAQPDGAAPEAPITTPEGPPGPEIPAIDRSCLIHSGHNLDATCDGCGDALCPMCEIHHHTQSLCISCLALRVQRRQSVGWRGWAAMLLGLAAIGALMAPYTIATDPAITQSLPGGKSFFVFATGISAASAIALGASAQDFVGIGRRAGVAGVALATLSLVGFLGLSALKVFSG